SFPQLIARGCGLDVHKNLIVASVSGEGLEEQTREFSAFTEDLEELRDWLNSLSVTHVAMESTSVYWKPVFNVLEEDFEIILVNARHIKNVPGHKTDKKDSQWIAQLLLSGLLKGSFIPPRPIRELRDLFRYRKKLTAQMVGEKNRLQKILEDANIKLSSVASDVFGASGMAIIQAIIDGETSAEALQQLAYGSLRKKEELRQALKGHITAHHRFMLKTFLKSIAQVQAIIDDIDLQIEEVLKDYQTEMELLQTIPGVGRQTAGIMIAEMGADMQQFPSQHHLACWAGVCPGNNESAGKKKVHA
ncbi:IS110 family transposase, partial [Cesiribacter sp. SM1]|uniref:IS110 family transposase n=1 Tax=Cesiribacter sp. SM1 TaxID=2861196 RepID=UPI001CD51286